LTRRHLHHALSVDLLIDRLTSGQSPQLQEELTPSYHWCLTKAMQPRPLERYDHTLELVHDLRLARIQMSGERLIKRGHDHRLQLTQLLETHESASQSLSPINFSESIRSLRLYHQAERSYWAAVQLSSGDVREEAEIGLQETLEAQLKLLTFQGEYSFARRLYQELPTEHPQLLQELEELNDQLTRSSSLSSRTSPAPQSTEMSTSLEPTLTSEREEDSSKTLPNTPVLRSFVIDSETVAPIELDVPEGMIYSEDSDEVFDSALDLESDLLELHSVNPAPPPPWRITAESPVIDDTSSDALGATSEREKKTPPPLTLQEEKSPLSWEENLANIGQLFEGDLDDDWASEEHSEIVDLPTVSQQILHHSEATSEVHQSAVPMVDRHVNARKAPRDQTLDSRGILKPQLTLDPSTIDTSIVGGDEGHASPRGMSTLVTDEDLGQGTGLSRALITVLALACVLCGVFVSILWTDEGAQETKQSLSGDQNLVTETQLLAQDSTQKSEPQLDQADQDSADDSLSNETRQDRVNQSGKTTKSDIPTDADQLNAREELVAQNSKPITPDHAVVENPSDQSATGDHDKGSKTQSDQTQSQTAQGKPKTTSQLSRKSTVAKPIPQTTQTSASDTSNVTPEPQAKPFTIQPDRSRPYTVLVSSFKNRKDAERIARLLTKRLKTPSPWIIEVDLGRKGTRYRVLVGQFRSGNEAKRVIAPLKRLKFKPLIRTWIRWVQ
jgi:cell division protein FtsN